MYTVPSEEGRPLSWGQLLFVSSAMLLISGVIWREVSSFIDPLWNQASYLEQQANHLIPGVAIGGQFILILLVLRGRWCGWSNQLIRRLLGLLVVTVIVFPFAYTIWKGGILSEIRCRGRLCASLSRIDKTIVGGPAFSLYTQR
jgi:hypothetical protein